MVLHATPNVIAMMLPTATACLAAPTMTSATCEAMHAATGLTTTTKTVTARATLGEASSAKSVTANAASTKTVTACAAAGETVRGKATMTAPCAARIGPSAMLGERAIKVTATAALATTTRVL
jgi:hypothetical protein